MNPLSLKAPRFASGGRLSLCLLLSGCLLPGIAFATDALWQNSGTITSPPQIDASNFFNSGSIQIFTSLPFETANTLNFTNSGTMVDSPGWLFDDAASSSGVRLFSDNFINLNGAEVQSLDSSGLAIAIIGGTVLGIGNSSSSYLW